MTTQQIKEIMMRLARRRPVFHSEADFQFEFAWELTDGKVGNARLEVPLAGVGEVDLVVPSPLTLIEFKYKTLSSTLCHEGENFSLKSHGAQPLGRYDVIKDVARIEISGQPGFVIFITNDPTYWNAGATGNGAAFSLRQGNSLSGILKWQDTSNTNSIGKQRVDPIRLNGAYNCDWSCYAKINTDIFKYILFQVNSPILPLN